MRERLEEAAACLVLLGGGVEVQRHCRLCLCNGAPEPLLFLHEGVPCAQHGHGIVRHVELLAAVHVLVRLLGDDLAAQMLLRHRHDVVRIVQI